MGRSTRITITDCRALLRLAGELQELPNDPHVQGTHFCNRVSHLLGAQLTMLMETDDCRPSVPGLPTWAIATGWPNAAAPEIWRQSVQDSGGEHPTMKQLLKFPGRAVTRRRQELVADRQWNNCAFFNDYIRGVGCNEHICFMQLVESSSSLVFCGIHRALEDRRFSVRDQKLAHLINEEFAWFFRRLSTRLGTRNGDGRLPPRLQRTLDGLLEGLSEKQIAYRHGLSRHTIHGYVKMLHRRFRVASRGELLAVFIERQHDDVDPYHHQIKAG
jgi:hypothetical protein